MLLIGSVTMHSRLDDLYEDDFYAWTRDQAHALRRLAETRPNEPVDWAHVIEEVLDLGKEQRNALRSWAARTIEHLLLLEHSSAKEPRRAWMKEVRSFRGEIARRLSPTLKRDLAARLPALYKDARAEAAFDLESYGELEAAERLPPTCPYILAQVLDPAWWPGEERA